MLEPRRQLLQDNRHLMPSQLKIRPLALLRRSSQKARKPGSRGDDGSKAHDVVTTIHIDYFTGNARARIGSQKHSSCANFINVYISLQRRTLGVDSLHIGEAGDAASCKSLDRPGRNGVDPDFAFT